MKNNILALSLFVAVSFSTAKADVSSDQEAEKTQSWFTRDEVPVEPRNTFWIPFLSLVIPGTGQFIEGEYTSGSIYFGSWVGGGIYASSARKNIGKYQDTSEYKSFTDEDRKNYESHGEYPRKYSLGSQISFAAGSFSAYHNFHTRVQSHKLQGGYSFLEREDTPEEIMAAPFKFEFLKRPSTYIPIGIAGLYYLLATNVKSKEIARNPLSNSDVGFAGAYSYLAGTHEEALFRGWLLPTFREATGSDFWANGITALGFAASHLGTVPVPLPQFLLGWHMGNVTINNKWSIQESIFIHNWWNVIIFLGQYQTKLQKPAAALTPVLWLPPLELRF